MKLLSFEDYSLFYKKHSRCIDDISKPNKALTEKRLLGKYEKYVKKEQRKQEKQSKKIQQKADEWDELKDRIIKRDYGVCQFLEMVKREMSQSDLELIIEKGAKLTSILDLAHIFPRSTYPELKLDEDNCVLVNRYCHSLLDEFRSPITGKRISLQERLNFFLLLLPRDRLERLKSKVNNKELFFND